MKRGVLFALCGILVLATFLPGCNMFQEENKPPIAVFSSEPPLVNVGETIYFSANDSVDKDGKIVKYSWNFGDGAYALGSNTNHVYSDGGEYVVELVVKDDNGAVDRANTTVEVNEWPLAEGRVGKDPAKIDETVMFDGTYSCDTDGEIVSYVWDFGDKTPEITGKTPSHAYHEIGGYNVTLTVTDDDGAEAQHIFEVQVIKRHYKVTWEESSVSLGTISDYLEENNTMNKTLEVDLKNLTSIEFNMTWNDLVPMVGGEAAANDEFMFTVVSPKENLKKKRTMAEVIVHEFTLSDPPETIKMEGRSIDDVEDFISGQYTTSKGTGEWLLSIECIEAGDWYLDVFDADKGNDWEIEITGYQYTANIVETG